MKNNIKPKVTLIGACPGDSDLIMVKGVKALKNANVVLYDALVNRDLLAYAPTAKLINLIKKHQVKLIKDSYKLSYLEAKHLVIVTTDVIATNIEVHTNCKERNILVNVADNPSYYDFYMGGIVTKGNVKIAISTNGKSSTLAKRLRQFF